jgi:3-oxoacyl-ACP reductase-like protein
MLVLMMVTAGLLTGCKKKAEPVTTPKTAAPAVETAATAAEVTAAKAASVVETVQEEVVKTAEQLKAEAQAEINKDNLDEQINKMEESINADIEADK